ncbi:unnamed protein product [Merluccius merluccius]
MSVCVCFLFPVELVLHLLEVLLLRRRASPSNRDLFPSSTGRCGGRWPQESDSPPVGLRSAVQQCDMMAGPHVPLAQHNNNNSRHSQPTSNAQAMYCTSYGSSYGRENFTPCLGHRHGTDYAPNPRPAVYYRTSLGYHDKPSLGALKYCDVCRAVEKPDSRGRRRLSWPTL